MTIKELGTSLDDNYRNDLNNNFRELSGFSETATSALSKANLAEQQSNSAKQNAESAKQIAQEAKVTSESANTTSKSVQDQLNQIVVDGDSSVEAAQARLDEKGITHTTLKERIDFNILNINKQINDIGINVKYFGAKGDGMADDTDSIQKALDLAKTLGSVEVIIPNGTYRISKYLVVYKNTKIKMQKKTILLRGHGGGFFKNGNTGDMFTGYDGHGNITIEGGTLDGNVLNYNYGFNHTGWARGKNITFRDITFKDVINNHFMDINACDGVLIDNCRFLGYKDITVDSSRGFAEAIQITNHTQLGYGEFGVWDGTPTKNVIVRNCYFGHSGTNGMGPVATAVGNHGSVYGVYNENIKIINCTFEGLSYAGVRPFKYKNFLVDGCTFLNCQRGVVCTNPDGNGDSGNDGAGNVIGLPQSGKNYTINNNIFIGTKEEHIFAVAWFKGTDYDRMTNLTISNNQFVSQDPLAITNSKAAMYIMLTGNTIITNNIFKDVHRAIYAGYVSDFVFSQNKIENVTSEAVFINEPDVAYQNLGHTFNVDILNNSIRSTGRVAIFIQFAKRFRVEGNNINSPANETDNSRSGINCANSAKDGFVRGNRVVMATAGNQNKYGIEVSGSCINVQVTDNYLEGKTGKALVNTANGNFSGFLITDANGNTRRVTIDASGVQNISAPI